MNVCIINVCKINNVLKLIYVLKFIVVNVLSTVSVTPFYRYDVSLRIGRRGRYRITLGF